MGKSGLILKVREETRSRNYSYKTEQAYVRRIIRYVRYHGTRHPRRLSRRHVQQYLNCLADERNVAASTQNLDFDYRPIAVHSGKGLKDRLTIMPRRCEERLKEQVLKVKHIHNRDLRDGFGIAVLPKALAVKYPDKSNKLRWQ